MNKLRSQLIATYINNHSYASFHELCEQFQVSSATMRRDLTELEKKGEITRVHGGAKSVQNTEYQMNGFPLNDRSKAAVAEKKRIATYAVKLISPNETIMLDSSTITVIMAELLQTVPFPLNIVTNDTKVATVLSDCSHINIIMLGGYLRKHHCATTGPFTEQMLKEIYIDKTFIGFDSIDLERGLASRGLNSIACKQIEIRRATKSYAVGEHQKFSVKSFYKICDLTDLDCIITDSLLDDEIYKKYKNAKHTIVRT